MKANRPARNYSLLRVSSGNNLITNKIVSAKNLFLDDNFLRILKVKIICLNKKN